jgi:SAM-dependent methyltransferase
VSENPWLEIPADDYLGHMASPEVGQSQVLNRLFREALDGVRPRSLLVLGCAHGNGFEHIDPAVTSRVVGVDIHPGYLQRLRERFPAPGFALDLRCADLSGSPFELGAFDLVHAALVLEYVDWSPALTRVAEALGSNGLLSVVLQLPSPTIPAVTPTRFRSLESLEAIFRFVDPEALTSRAGECGLSFDSGRREPLEAGKSFAVLRFRKGAKNE